MTKMRAAIAFCLMPWIIIIIARLMFYDFPQDKVIMIATAMWATISPAISALAILVTYREGQWSKNDEIVDLQLENDALKLENAKLKAGRGVQEFD